MYSVVKRDGRIIDFDLGKISEAIQKAFAAVEPVLEEIDAMMEEAIDNFGRVVKLLTVTFLEHAHVYRAARLLRTQDRGTGENSDSDNIKNIILRSYISVESL